MSFPIPSPNMYPFDPIICHAFFSPRRTYDLTSLFESIQSEIHKAKTIDGKESLLQHSPTYEGYHEVLDILSLEDPKVEAFFTSLNAAFRDYQEDHKIPTDNEWQEIENQCDAIMTDELQADKKKAIEAFNYTLGVVSGLQDSTEKSDYEYAFGLVDSLYALHLNTPDTEQGYLINTLHNDMKMLTLSGDDLSKKMVIEDVQNIYKWMDKHKTQNTQDQ